MKVVVDIPWSASLRGSFAGSKARAAQDTAKSFACKGERTGWRSFGEEAGMHKLMSKGLAVTMPPMCATEDETEPIARAMLFSCFKGWTWLVTEYDPETGETFGLVRGFEEEWGYFSP